MKLTVSVFNRKEMPSKWGQGTWQIIKIKAKETGDKVWELKGFNSQTLKDISAGKVLFGFPSVRRWATPDGKEAFIDEFNRINADYVYNLLLKKFPDIENPSTMQHEGPTEEEWSSLESQVDDMSL